MTRMTPWALFVAGWIVSLTTAGAHEPESTRVDPRAFGAVMPRLSSDGQQLAFSYQGAIWRMPRAGGEMTRLTSAAGFDVEPAWSADGKQVAFLSGPGFGSGVLAVIDAQSGERIKLPSDIAGFDKLHFDKSGGRILGLFQPQNERIRLAWYDLQSGELTSPLPPESWPGHPPGTSGIARQRFALSHDEKWLAVVSTADEPGEQTGNRGPQTELWRVSLAGGKPERIVQWPARIHDVCWRADDRAIFLASERGGVHHDLWEVPLAEADANARKLTFGQADESSPSVSGDGKWLMYSDNRLGPTTLVLRDLASGQEQIVAPAKRNFGSPTGTLQLNVVESDGAPTTARVIIKHEQGKFHAPPGALYRLLGSDMHFYVDEHERVELPIGEYTVVAARGPEHRQTRQTLTITTNQTTKVPVKIERWTNQRAEGWVSGENHIHANYGYGQWYNSPATMRLQVAGEDLTVANFMVANSDGDGVFDREFFLGRPDPLSTDQTILYWNEEFRSTIWGHMTLLNLKRLVVPIFTGFDRTTHHHDGIMNADIADHTHEQDGLVNYTHPAHSLQDPYGGPYTAKEMPIDVALGKVDSIDVMGSNHVANLPVWYRMLNCGLKVPASAGTDVFLNRVNSRLPGSDRVYVHCGEKFSYQDWIAGLRAGKTFVTNGPMLRLTVNDQEAGATIKLEKPSSVRLVGQAIAQFPLTSLEVIVNGQVVATAPPSGDGLRLALDQDVPIERSGWIALRAKGQRGPTQQAAEAFAHTSAVYVEVAGQPVECKEDAEYFIRWINRLYEDVRVRNRIPAGRQKHVEEQIAKALEFYRRLANSNPAATGK
ncbi:MAG TPA: CehA/McbA family metallohydrolase [Pirellulaceae bacterium]|nr:CehA/McbA family metallohydrolase [Pirellulaceae bacterium]